MSSPRPKGFILTLTLTFLGGVSAYPFSSHNGEQDNSSLKIIKNWFNQCSKKQELFKCLKIQALKVVDRAIQIRNFDVVDGITIVSSNGEGRSFSGLTLNESKLENLSPDELDSLLGETTQKFLDTHRVEVNLPKLVEEGRQQRDGGGGGGGGGGKGGKGGKGGSKGGGGMYGPMIWALAIKGSFLAMAYKGIAVMAGTALIIGKMALLLAAILGLKKLVSGNNEKTTFEIIKQPKYIEEHVQSGGYEEEDHGYYRRNGYQEVSPEQTHKKVYRFQLPEK